MKLQKELISYVIFGILTTLVNIIVYFFLTKVINVDYVISNIVAWFFSVLFAYVTNKLWVFESKNVSIIKEMLLFYGGRIFSGVVDTLLMIIFIELLSINDATAKIVIQIIVVVLNYLISKFIVFK